MNRILSTTRTVTRSTPILRSLSTSIPRSSQPTFNSPSPPLLRRSDQKAFEESVKKVQNPANTEAGSDYTQNADGEIVLKTKKATEEELTMHPDFRRKPKAEFEGATNPETGEIGGPKVNPLSHGE